MAPILRTAFSFSNDVVKCYVPVYQEACSKSNRTYHQSSITHDPIMDFSIYFWSSWSNRSSRRVILIFGHMTNYFISVYCTIWQELVQVQVSPVDATNWKLLSSAPVMPCFWLGTDFSNAPPSCNYFVLVQNSEGVLV